MTRLHIASLIFSLLGITCMIISGLQGELRVGVFLIFPFIIGFGLVALVGFLFLVLAFFMFILGFNPTIPTGELLTPAQENRERKQTIKGGGIVLVGPIPIVIGSSWKIALALILAALVLILLVYFLFYFNP